MTSYLTDLVDTQRSLKNRPSRSFRGSAVGHAIPRLGTEYTVVPHFVPAVYEIVQYLSCQNYTEYTILVSLSGVIFIITLSCHTVHTVGNFLSSRYSY